MEAFLFANVPQNQYFEKKSTRMKPSKAPFFQGANAEIFKRANNLRKNTTKAESILWQELRNRKLENIKFRRQHSIGKFIVDFYCHSAKLVIEVDGDIHNEATQKERDIEREYELTKLELKVIRFTNKQVLSDIHQVLKEIQKHLPCPSKSPQMGRL